MKKRYIVLSGLLAVTLAACSQEKPKNEENTQKTEQTSQPEGTVGSKSQASSQKKAEVVNKGDYYSIQGKYDEIVIANKHYPLSKDYNPGENPTAKAELLKLIAAMQAAPLPAKLSNTKSPSLEYVRIKYCSKCVGFFVG